MAYYEMMPAGLPAGLQSGMDSVLNKKFGTATSYAPGTWPDTVNLMGPLPIMISNKAPIVSFNDGADDVPVESGTFYIVPSQAGTGTPSPSNPRAISGYTGMTITKTGKNLCNSSNIEQGSINGNTGANVNSTTRVRSGYIKINAGTDYTISIGGTANLYELYQYKADNTLARTYIAMNAQTFTFTSHADCAFIRFSMRFSDNSTILPSDISNLQVETGSTATTYSAFTSETLAMSWQDEAGNVYGGEFNVTTGVLTVNYILLDLSTSSYWNMNNDTQFRLRWANYLSANGWNGSWSNIESNVFQCVNPSTSFSNMPDYSFRNVSQNYYNFEVKVPTGLFANASAFMSWLANVDGNGTHAYICIERNPSDVQTYQLTPHELRTFLGANNFYCDTGDSQLNYREDINLALQALSGSRGLMMARPQLEPETEPEETIEETPEEMER